MVLTIEEIDTQITEVQKQINDLYEELKQIQKKIPIVEEQRQELIGYKKALVDLEETK